MSIATAVQQVESHSSSAAGRVVGVLAEFDTVDQIKAAARKVRDAGFTKWDTHTPFPVHGIDREMGIQVTKLPYLVMAMGMVGCATGIFLTWWTNAASQANFTFLPNFIRPYQYMISGKPEWSFAANIPVIFELTVLFAALTTVFGMLGRNNLPLFHNPIFTVPRFARVTTDKFFLSIDATDPKFRTAEATRMLESLGSRHAEAYHEQPGSSDFPVAFKYVGLVATLAALIPLTIVFMARGSFSSQPRIHLIQDMDNQEKFKAQSALDVFADGRSNRPRVAGALARGDLREDRHYWEGIVNNDYATTFPTHNPAIKLTEEFIVRGQQRFNIYCAPCHGYDGSGNGAVNVRAVELQGAWVPANDLHDAERKSRVVGHIYNTITNGIRTMPAYADQIPENDRWAIVAYVKALQRSTMGKLEDLKPQARGELESRGSATPTSRPTGGATPR
ncbi:MAG: quinol:electron acceptor oxidoreductase subunit ActD [Phycisphaerae bacterium]